MFFESRRLQSNKWPPHTNYYKHDTQWLTTMPTSEKQLRAVKHTVAETRTGFISSLGDCGLCWQYETSVILIKLLQRFLNMSLNKHNRKMGSEETSFKTTIGSKYLIYYHLIIASYYMIKDSASKAKTNTEAQPRCLFQKCKPLILWHFPITVAFSLLQAEQAQLTISLTWEVFGKVTVSAS